MRETLVVSTPKPFVRDVTEGDLALSTGMTHDGFRTAIQLKPSYISPSPSELTRARIEASLSPDTQLASTLIRTGSLYTLFEELGGERQKEQAGGIKLPDNSVIGVPSIRQERATLWEAVRDPRDPKYPQGFKGTSLTYAAIKTVDNGHIELIVPEDETIQVITVTGTGIEGRITIPHKDPAPEFEATVYTAGLLRQLPGFETRIRARVSAEGREQPVLRAPIMTG